MLITQEHYFENQNLMDIRLVSTVGFSESDIAAIAENDDVKDIYPSYSKDVFVENDKDASVIAKLMAYPDSGMNSVILLEGRLPESSDECLVEKHSQLEVVHEIGDTVSVYTTDPNDPLSDSLERNSWTVVGIVMSPQYIAYGRGTATIGDGAADTYIMVPKENFLLDVFTEVYVTLKSTEGLAAFGDEYSNAVENSVSSFEEIGTERAPLRLSEIKNEAYSEINKAKEELSDAEKELLNANEELLNGKKELEEGWADYYSGLKEYREGVKTFNGETTDAKEKLDDAEREIIDGWKAYNDGYKQYSEGMAQFNEGLESAGMTVESLYTTRRTLTAAILLYKTIPGSEDTVAELEAQLDSVNSTIDAYEQLVEAGEQLSTARIQLTEAEKQLYEGRKELNKAKIEGEKELSDAKESLESGYEKLVSAQKEFDEGLEEFNKAKAEAEPKIADVKAGISNAENALEELGEAKWYVFTRDDNPGYSTYESDVYIIESVGKVFPVFFLLVALLVCLTTMTRMVEEQRTQIGTMKALGYGKDAILLKYIVYSSLASISGSVFGIAVCVTVFPIIIYTAYEMRYLVPQLEMVAMPSTWIFVTVVCVLCTGFAAVMAGYSELRENPAKLMRPKAPKVGKRVFLERIPVIWNRLSFTKKVTVRNLFRYKKRICMTVLGIAGCAALTLTGFGLFSSISAILEKQYNELFNYDLIVSVDTNASEEDIEAVFGELEQNAIAQKNLPAHIMSVRYENIPSISLISTADSAELEEMILFRDPDTGERYHLSDEGVIITELLSDMTGLSSGDEITFYSGEMEFTAKITAVTENYAMHFIYMTNSLYTEICGSEPEVNSVFTIMSYDDEEHRSELGNTLTEYSGVLALSFSKTAIDTFNDTVENLNYVVVLIIVCAAALAFVVLYNLTNINITERIREIATIKVLGFYDGEVAAYVFRENVILSFVGAGVGLLLGVVLHSFVLDVIQTDEIMFKKGLPLWTFAVAFAMTLLFSAIVNGIMYFRLKKISMVESLKSIE